MAENGRKSIYSTGKTKRAAPIGRRPVFYITGNFVPRYIKNAPRGSHCGEKEECRFRDPPQAENPAKQDSFLFNGKLRSPLYKNAPRGSHCGEKEECRFRDPLQMENACTELVPLEAE